MKYQASMSKISPASPHRHSTGIEQLDELLGGGLLPGTLTVVLGATGIGKSQFGIQYAHAGLHQEGQRGFLFDMTARGDSQSHADYAERICDWSLQAMPLDQPFDPEAIWDSEATRFDLMQPFERLGKRVTRDDLDPDEYRQWQADLTKKLDQTIRYFYANFIHGARRCVIDGIEPSDRPSDSFQFNFFEYIHSQILRKEAAWLARDLLRVDYRRFADEVARHDYDHQQISSVILCTSQEVMLDDLLSRSLEAGDLLSNANTIILMGKVRDGMKMTRALHIAKHRGSRCDESIVPYQIDERGMTLAT